MSTDIGYTTINVIDTITTITVAIIINATGVVVIVADVVDLGPSLVEAMDIIVTNRTGIRSISRGCSDRNLAQQTLIATCTGEGPKLLSQSCGRGRSRRKLLLLLKRRRLDAAVVVRVQVRVFEIDGGVSLGGVAHVDGPVVLSIAFNGI